MTGQGCDYEDDYGGTSEISEPMQRVISCPTCDSLYRKKFDENWNPKEEKILVVPSSFGAKLETCRNCKTQRAIIEASLMDIPAIDLLC